MRNAGPQAKVITTVGDAAESGLSPSGSFWEPEPQDRVPVSGRSCGPDVEWQSEERTPDLTEPGKEVAEAEQEVCQLQP